MNKAQHTPTPWRVMGTTGIATENNVILFDPAHERNNPLDSPEMEANAAFIVRAVNNHEALVEALEMMLENPFEPRNEYTAPLRFAKARAALKAAQAV